MSTKYVFNFESNIAGSKEGVQASKILLKVTAPFTGKRIPNTWTATGVLIFVNIFPVHIMGFYWGCVQDGNIT